METNMLQLDGSIGEGGGQILRTALSLSLLTGKPFQLINIRAGRKKPGLMRQHLVCVQAAKAIGQAKVTGDPLSRKLCKRDIIILRLVRRVARCWYCKPCCQF
jgi:RNA 3'-terminal phosphate cyclase (ATP)